MSKHITIPSIARLHLRMLSPALAIGGIKMTVLVKDNPQVRAFSAELSSQGLCAPAAVFGAQLADALSRGAISPNTEFFLPAIHPSCNMAQSAMQLQQFLRDKNLPVVPLLSAPKGVPDLNQNELIAAAPKAIGGLCGGDLLTQLSLQARAYAISAEEVDALTDAWSRKFSSMASGNLLRLRPSLRSAAKDMIKEFQSLPTKRIRLRQVGILGAPFLKYSDVANHGLYDLLAEAHCVPVFCGVTDLIVSKLETAIQDNPALNKPMQLAAQQMFGTILDIRKDMSALMNKTGLYCAPVPVKKKSDETELRALSACGVSDYLVLSAEGCSCTETEQLSQLRASRPDLHFAQLSIPVGGTKEQLFARIEQALQDLNGKDA